MTPKEKAADLICDFHEVKSNEYNYGITWEMAIQCALIAVDTILSLFIHECADTLYWREVKQEILKLKTK
jgi:hypothetical protein